jgi:hypothetical protein
MGRCFRTRFLGRVLSRFRPVRASWSITNICETVNLCPIDVIQQLTGLSSERPKLNTGTQHLATVKETASTTPLHQPQRTTVIDVTDLRSGFPKSILRCDGSSQPPRRP